MKRATLGLLSTVLLFSVMAAYPATSEIPAGDEEIVIQVSPSTILLDWNAKGDVKVTVHAEVPYRFFNDISSEDLIVTLDGISASYIYADARGDLVVKFDYFALKALLLDKQASGTAPLHLSAVDEDGVIYEGSDEVRIVNR